MGDQTAIEPHDTPPFQGPYYPLTEGQRSGQVFCHDTLKEVGHFGSVPESSGTHNINSICCSNSSSVCSGRGTNACVSEDNGTLNNWIGHPLIHTQVDAGKFGSGAGRGRSQSDGYLPKWHPAYRHQGALGRGDGACEQKLDSFTEAFARRSPSMPPIQNGNRGAVFGMILGAGMGGVNSGLDSAGSVTDSSGPPAPHPPSLLLSPPPTPLSLGPLSPPKRTHFPTVQVTQLMQSAQSTQADAPCSSAQFCAGLQTYYPASLLAQPTNSPGPTLPGKCSPLDWVQQSDDPMGNGDTSYPHLQHRDSDQTLMYSGQEEFSVRHTPSNQHEDFRNTDHCSLQTPLSSPQGPYSQPCVSFQSDRNPMTTTDHVTSWCQEAPDRGTPLPYISPLPPCSMPSLPHLQGDGFRPVDGGKQDFGAEVTVSGTQCPTKGKNGSHLSYSGIPFTSILQAGRTAEAVFPGTLPHYTPRPMLNPIRRGTGLYCNLLPPSYLQSHCSE
ncbi:hypothetical protein JZ751_006763 [Albula glossodonta]|uniref:Uncharacterized protein n=1 Tax=Albula glossodonta TaxID=121402 RepID=A0A8T2P9Z3_9TELE|nr:hypothetical protein JZ751_006763 [Albula glossodonta]